VPTEEHADLRCPPTAAARFSTWDGTPANPGTGLCTLDRPAQTREAMYNEAYLDGIAKSWHAAHKHTRQLDGHSKKVRSRPAASVCWEVSACRCCVHRMQCQVHSVAWNCTGKRIASGSVDQTARIWTIAEGRHVKDIELRGHQDSVDQLRWDPGNADILSKHTSAVQMRFSLSASVHSHGWRG
jgi:hypothetical protein